MCYQYPLTSRLSYPVIQIVKQPLVSSLSNTVRRHRRTWMYALETELPLLLVGTRKPTSFSMMACWEIGHQESKFFFSFQQVFGNRRTLQVFVFLKKHMNDHLLG
uniref:Uncharacterized protein n=1 Tax=Setaria italica TaxID=4555 RepID=K3XNH7_SETIT